jgi:hypothetical protein
MLSWKESQVEVYNAGREHCGWLFYADGSWCSRRIVGATVESRCHVRRGDAKI